MRICAYSITIFLLGVSLSAPAAPRPPLEGPLTWVTFTATDERSPEEFDFFVTSHVGNLAGTPLPSAQTSLALGILDSGSATHMVNYSDAVDLGITGSFISGFTFPVGGVSGSINVDVSIPIGVFVHGLVETNATPHLDHSLTVGQGNFPLLVNTFSNFNAGNSLPSILGAPLFAFYPVEVKNSTKIEVIHRGEKFRTATVTFYLGADDPFLPSYPHRVALELLPPTSVLVQFLALPDFFADGYLMLTPAVISLGSLYQTASENLTLTEGETTVSIKMIADTGAQATLISEGTAADLGIILAQADFEVAVGGVGGTNMTPGVYVDELHLPTTAGGLTWSDVPVVVVDIQGPDGTTVDGILGSNVIGNRDFVFNGAAATPYLELSSTVIPPDPVIADFRKSPSGVLEFDWDTDPAPPKLYLETAPSPSAQPNEWSIIATGELASIQGTIITTNSPNQAAFRLTAPSQ